ncbi:MAG: hypothetical protein FJ297_05940 [Planctomycetes bacterium]|nr:hypothetical protein [Planctomycetota bacterium]
MNRRKFLHDSIAAGVGFRAITSCADSALRGDLVAEAHFQSVHVVSLNQLKAPRKRLVEGIRRKVETDKQSWSWTNCANLEMSGEKLSLLILIIRHITDHYDRSDLFTEWAHRLVWREEFAATGDGGIGLGHQFEGHQTLTTLEREVDWWVFLIPNGIEFHALDGQPVYLVVVPVFGQHGMHRQIISWATTMRLGKHLHPQRVARNIPAKATDSIISALCRSLREVRYLD